MNNVHPFRRKTSFKFSAPRAETVPEGVVLLAGLAVTAWLPTILWCIAINHNLPLDIVAVTELFGGVIGLGLHQYPPPGPPRCVPKEVISQVSNDRDYPKAA